VIFKNQARGTEDKGKKEFVNVCFSLARLWLFPEGALRASVGADAVCPRKHATIVLYTGEYLLMCSRLLGSVTVGLPQTLHEVSAEP
jgi:hypothetical protein